MKCAILTKSYKLLHGHVSIDTNLLPSTTNNNRTEEKPDHPTLII